MSSEVNQDRIVERLRANLRAAGIQITDADIEGMNERGFLRTVIACEEITERTPENLIPDYLGAWGDAEQIAAAATGPAWSAEPPPFGPGDKGGYPTIAQVSQRLRAREISPVELTQEAIDRIAERDPRLNSIQAVLADEALDAARQAERDIAAGDYRGPLHGIPVGVKDLFAVAGHRTSAGSKILADWVPDFDSAVVERLRGAGAIIVAQTRMSEFAYNPSSGNAHYGETHNPWNVEHDTGGSSSGSGAAVADGMLFGAIGSDTGGSIRMPAALCGIVGIKPTFGLVSLYGAVTLSWSLDHGGPMTRTVEDNAIMLNALAGYDPRDPRSREVPLPDYTEGINAGVRGLRVGVLREDGADGPLATDEMLAAWRAGLETLERNGAQLVDLDLPEYHDLRALNGGIIAMEAAAYHQPMLRARLEDFGPFMRHRILAAYAFGPNSFIRLQQARAAIRRRFNTIFEQVDVLSTPTLPYAAPKLGEPGRNTWFCGPINSLSWPAITVPVGLGDGRLPLGMQLAGRPWDEATLFRAAAVVEADGPWPGGKP